jgi:hypothetical protein
MEARERSGKRAIREGAAAQTASAFAVVTCRCSLGGGGRWRGEDVSLEVRRAQAVHDRLGAAAAPPQRSQVA